MNIEDLITEGENILANEIKGTYGNYVENTLYEPWKRKSLLFLQRMFPNDPQVSTFEKVVQKNNFSENCISLLAILQAYRDVDVSGQTVDYDKIIDIIFNHFHAFAHNLKRRYNNRTTITIADEYDVQDLLNAIFALHFVDVRPEEWTPSYAGGCNRIDFLLKDEEIAVEVKMTRKGMNDKELGEQLLIDIDKYRSHPNCKKLYCFVYDPDGFIRNPRGLEKDLDNHGKDLKKFMVKTYIRPNF